jgi:hypothetical protein
MSVRRLHIFAGVFARAAGGLAYLLCKLDLQVRRRRGLAAGIESVLFNVSFTTRSMKSSTTG